MPQKVDRSNYRDIFLYHKPDEYQIVQIEKIRDGAIQFAKAILENTTDCADRADAIRKVREAMMAANAAIVLKGVI